MYLIPTEGGRFIIQDGDAVQTYDSSGRLVVSQFSGIAADGVFKMSRSHVAGKLAARLGQCATWGSRGGFTTF